MDKWFVFQTNNPPQTQNLIMKITSWNIRGMNSSSKQILLKSKVSKLKASIILLQETKCDEVNTRRITKRIWLGCEAIWITT
jgi:exonuclease III